MFENLGPTLLALWIALWPVILGGGLGVLVLWLYNKYFGNEDSKYKIYYPLVIQAVKLAEKSIDDDVENKSLAKADLFLKEFIRLVEDETGTPVSMALRKWANRVKEEVLLKLDEIKSDYE